MEPSSETTEFSSAAEKAAELEPGFCHRMLEFQIEYPRDVAVLRAGVPRNPVARACFCSRVRLLLNTPCAEPVFHSLDYQIELVAFRNWIRYG